MATSSPPGHVLVAVTGSIAAYKAGSVVRGVMERGAEVRVAMTEAAREFISATTFRALTGNPVATRLFVPEDAATLVHVNLADWADALAVVPATANVLGKFACGIADEIVSCTWMACDCPRLVAPAMNTRMWNNPAVRENCSTLAEKQNARFIGPVKGPLAEDRSGMGRLAPVDDIVEGICELDTTA
jgi:phosphopantothenoylcysteine decarboxylase/phosphopantothenate--cysteine ligase